MSTAPASTVGAKARANLRPGPESSGRPTARVLTAVDTPPTATDATAATSQAPSHRGLPTSRPAAAPATSAARPMTTRPQPEKVVKAEADSIVSRMKRRSAIARA